MTSTQTAALVSTFIPSALRPACLAWWAAAYTNGASRMAQAAQLGDLALTGPRPNGEDGLPINDHAWHVQVWAELGQEAAAAKGKAEAQGSPDAGMLAALEGLADGTCARLADAYQIEW